MFIPDEKLKKILLKSGMLDEPTWADAVENANRLDTPVEDILKERDIISGHIFYELVAKALNLPYVNLKAKDITEDVLRLFSNEIVGKYKAIPFEYDAKKKLLKVAFQDPLNKKNIAALARKTKKKIEVHFTGKSSYKFAARYYQKYVAQEIKILIERAVKRFQKKNKPTRKEQGEADRSARAIFEKIIEYVYYIQPSDIHIEQHLDGGAIKFRVDGFLKDEFLLPYSWIRKIIQLIKDECAIKTDIHHQTRDSRFSRIVFDEYISFRISIIPTYYGEKICLRVLDESRQKTSLRDLGFSDTSITQIKADLKKPYGLILVSGPTGSGKSSTLYSLLKFLNVEGVSIATIEDPVEYSIPHVNQTQVDTDNSFTFAQGLRAILRQDPNVIMVGEVRDNETAGITIQSALTGHIVISTLHSNTAAGTITRLKNMDIKPYLLAPTINLVISQRLVKMICPHCRESYPADTELLTRIDKDTKVFTSLDRLKSLGLLTFNSYEEIRFYKGRGCQKCKGKGSIGRIGLFEIMKVDDAIRRMILDEKSEAQIQAKAQEGGMLTLFEDGLLKAINGETTIEEIMRITV